MSSNGRAADTETVDERTELRQHISHVLETRAATITNDAVATLAYAGSDPADEVPARLAELVIQVLIIVIRDGEVDSRSAYVSDLRRLAREKALPVRQLERRTADELLAAFAERLGQEAGDEALIDPLTTLHTRAVLMAAMEKEIQRSERFAHPFALIVFDVDRLAHINARHGYGFGDRVLERIGIVIRNYFREQDWVSRCSGDTFGVLLPETQREHAELLAERVRETVQERMSLRDYRTDEQVLVTVSVAVVIAEAVDSSVRADRLLQEAEQAVHRAKHAGRNRVERVEINVKATTPPTRDSEVL